MKNSKIKILKIFPYKQYMKKIPKLKYNNSKRIIKMILNNMIESVIK